MSCPHRTGSTLGCKLRADAASCLHQSFLAVRQAEGLVMKEEPYTLRVPRSQRGGEVVEPLVRDQWFIKMAPLAERALAAVAEGDVRIIPERFEKTYNHWLENIRARASVHQPPS